MKPTLFRNLTVSATLLAVVGCGVQTMAPQMAALPATNPEFEAQAKKLARHLVVGFAKTPTKAQLAQFEQTFNVKVVKALPKLAMVVVEVAGSAKGTRAALLKAPGVVFVEGEALQAQLPVVSRPAPIRFGEPQGNEDPYRKDQWYLEKIGVPQAWEQMGQLKTVKVAVIDTGVDLSHPDLQGVLLPGQNFETPGQPPQDRAGHGTMTSGLVGAIANNKQGIAGIAANAKIIPVKVGNSASSIAEAMQWAAENADLITMSLSIKPYMSEYPTAVEVTKRAANFVMEKGTPMVCSMGNTGDSSKNVPSAFAGNDVPNLIAVGATDKDDKVTSFSTFGAWCSVSAPGKDIITTAMGGQYKSVDGTSFSTPITAGVVALMLGRGVPKDPAVIKARLTKTAVDIGAPGFDPKAGAGRVDALKAVMQ